MVETSDGVIHLIFRELKGCMLFNAQAFFNTECHVLRLLNYGLKPDVKKKVE